MVHKSTKEQDRLAEIKEKFARRRGTLQWFFAGDPGETLDAEVTFLIAEVERLRAVADAFRHYHTDPEQKVTNYLAVVRALEALDRAKDG